MDSCSFKVPVFNLNTKYNLYSFNCFTDKSVYISKAEWQKGRRDKFESNSSVVAKRIDNMQCSIIDMKALKKYIRKREETIHALLEKPTTKFSPTTFHDLRVEIKKLDAVFDLIHFCIRDVKQKKLFTVFNEIFDQAGQVREFQLEEMVLNKYVPKNSLHQYKKENKKDLLKEKKIVLLVNLQKTDS